MCRSLPLLLSLLLSLGLKAAGPNLDLLTQEQADSVSREFSANFVHTAVAPAASLGDLFGFEVGLIGGVTDTPEIDRLSKTFDASSEADQIPHAGLLGVVSIPFGISGELSMIPEIDSSDVSLKHTSFALKWTFSNILDWPVDVAVRIHGSSSELSYKDTVNNSSTSNQDVETEVTYDTSSFGYHLTVSKSLLVFEPYLGYGRVSTDTDINTSASTTVSIFTFTGSDAYKSENSGSHFFMGANLNLLILKLGLEYSKLLDTDRITGKLSFYF